MISFVLFAIGLFLGCAGGASDAPSKDTRSEDVEARDVPSEELAARDLPSDALDADEVTSADADSTDRDSPPPPPPYVPVFQVESQALLDHLVADFWSPDGNWEGDMQGDATAFAPYILYASGKARLEEKATATVDYEVTIAAAVATTGVLSMEAVVGAPALADGFRNTGKTLYRAAFLLGARQGYAMIAANPEEFAVYVGQLATVYGTGAYLSLVAHEISGEQQDLDHALDLIARADATEWDDARGVYRYASGMDWAQATMIMALAKAYVATKDETHLTHATRALAGMDAGAWDAASGGYYLNEGKAGKTLSGNNNMVWAMLDLYEATGDATYLTKAKAVLEWVFSKDLYSPVEPMLFHDWTPAGRSDFYCTGCNFETLCNVHRLNALAEADASR